MSRAVLIRQRPALGDMVLLSATVRQLIRQRNFDFVAVVTDETYMGGALREIALRIPGVDVVDVVPMTERTTEENQRTDRRLSGASNDLLDYLHDFYGDEEPTEYFDANSSFLRHENEFHYALKVEKPELYGIAEFWLRNFGLWHEGMDALPKLNVLDVDKAAVDKWLGDEKRPLLGIVLRAGDSRRDWDFGGRSTTVIDWAHSQGYAVVTIDPSLTLNSPYATPCVNKPMGFVTALIARCDCVLTPDTGLMHVAQAVGTPTVSLWGLVHPMLRTKDYRTIRVPRERIPIAERPDEYSDLKRLPLQEALAGIETIMNMR